MKNAKKIAIIGGSQEQTFKKIGRKHGCEILFHPGSSRAGAKRSELTAMIRKSDCVVVLLGACSHRTEEEVKKICKERNVKVCYQQGFGASGAIQNGLQLLAS